MTIELSTEHEIQRLYEVEKWKRGTIAAELQTSHEILR